MKELKERNLEITKKFLDGRTHYGLAKEYDLHPNRIYQLIKNTKKKYKLN